MATTRHATLNKLFIYIVFSLSLAVFGLSASAYEDARSHPNDDGKRLTREYHLMQGALRGFIVKPTRQYDLQSVEIFLGIPYAAPPLGSLRFMPPVSAPPWSGVKIASRFAPVCPQTLPVIKKGNPPSLGRQHYLNRLKPFLVRESEDCLYLNIYVPYREQKSKKFPVLVFIHGDSFEWSSGNPYDGRLLSSYGNIMVITVNFRLGILGFLKPSLTEHVYGNNGLLDQLAALQWIKDNIEDLNGDPHSVTLMGHGTGAACVNFLMLSPISNGLFHRAILMSGSALSDWAMTRDPTQYTLQVAQSLDCNPTAKDLMMCLQNKTLSEIKKAQILSREFATPLGPVVAGSFIPNVPAETMESFPNLLSRYQILSGVTEFERYHDFGVIELDHGILDNQRDDFITKYAKNVFDGAENIALKEILKEYSPSNQDPQRWTVEANRDVILNMFSDARTLAPSVKFANYQAKVNRQSYFYVFGHNSVSTDFAPVNKSVHGEELPYVLGIPLGGAYTHFHSEYTQKEKLLSEVMMRLWTNFVKIGSPNTQSRNEYYTLDRKLWNQYNVDWPEYDIAHQSYLKLDIPPYVSSLYRLNFTRFWTETLPNKMRKYTVDPLFDFKSTPLTQKPRTTHRSSDPIRKTWTPPVASVPHYNFPNYGRVRPYSPPVRPAITDTDQIYREIKAIKTPTRHTGPTFIDKPITHSPAATQPPRTNLPANVMSVKTSGATITLIISLGILFLAVNAGICAALYYKKRKLQFHGRTLESTHHSRAEIGEVDVIGQKSLKEDKGALQSIKDGYTVIKSINLKKIRRSSSKNKKVKLESCKTPKSDDSGGFRERFQLRRHLSTSTLDAHTKVRDWIANEVMHRCSPSILTKSITDLNEKSTSKPKPFTRSEELLSEANNLKKDTLQVASVVLPAKKQNSKKAKTSEKTTSTSALGSHSSINSNNHSLASTKQTGKSNDSLKSKGNESVKSKKVSVAIDATPSARTQSILSQEPIELSKSLDIDQTDSTNENKLQRSRTEGEIRLNVIEIKPNETGHQKKIFTNEITLSLEKQRPLKISHSHSRSDPVADINYDILPPITFRNDINVTSKEDASKNEPLTPAEALLTIQRRNFPKVLPDLPRAQKRLSLQPTSLQSFQSFRSYLGNIESLSDRPKVPPQPPPRTTTLERRLAYKNTKPLSSFDSSNVTRIPETQPTAKNYENIDTLSPIPHTTVLLTKSLERSDTSKANTIAQEREYPKIIIASTDIPTSSQTSIIIKPSPSQGEINTNVARVRLPDDFHSQTGSVKSLSSFCSEDNSDDDDDCDDFIDDIDDDMLLKELVGGVESPTNSEVYLDTKGAESIYDIKQEIIPVKVNLGQNVSRNKDYVFISNLLLPDVTSLERTAKIKPNFGLNKLKDRSESINSPAEKAVKVKRKKGLKATTVLNKSFKGNRRSNDKDKAESSKLEHSTSGSSNDTETSTGTVRKIEIKKETGK